MSEGVPDAKDGGWVAEVFPTAKLARAGRLLPVSSRRRGSVRAAVARVADASLSARDAARRTGRDLDRVAKSAPRGRVLVLGVYQPDGVADMRRVADALMASRHEVSIRLAAVAGAAPVLATHTVLSDAKRGKFANLNRLLEGQEVDAFDWVLVVDDDVRLPARFLDRLIGVAAALDLHLCQPAQTWRSHAAWRVTRRRPAVARRTRFVEIGPVTLMRRDLAEQLTPFSEEGMGWGQCLHWAARAKRHGWALGVIDALAVRHERRRIASSYTEEEALASARSYLSRHEHIALDEAQRTIESVRALPAD